ncbi:MAG: hypothetical protein L6R38_001882 [Xanthoria sp. 2 TBL-2021]|nr:MAG: hypothetical protein L6R38_001882 [Xanthoria sp. 2 TBL-2021]
MPLLSYYDVLGVPQFATQDRIRKAYLELRDEPIPRDRLVDRRLLERAYKELGTESNRKAYDEYLWSLIEEETPKEKKKKKKQELEIAESRHPSPEIPMSSASAAGDGDEEGQKGREESLLSGKGVF